jgi:uncharacterized membrane protein
MSSIEQRPSEPGTGQPTLSNKSIALIVYVLYLVGYVTAGIAWIVGVMIAHLRIGSADDVTRTHFQFQIRTFWISVLYLVVGALLLHFFVGILVLIWLVIWTLVRNVKGLLALNDNKPIEKPTSWMFG